MTHPDSELYLVQVEHQSVMLQLQLYLNFKLLLLTISTCAGPLWSARSGGFKGRSFINAEVIIQGRWKKN